MMQPERRSQRDQPQNVAVGADDPLSLHGIDPDDAIRRALNTPLPDSVKRAERDAGEGSDEPGEGQPKQ